MIISIIILIITHAIVIPILLKVDKANNKVLSMFGLVRYYFKYIDTIIGNKRII